MCSSVSPTSRSFSSLLFSTNTNNREVYIGPPSPFSKYRYMIALHWRPISKSLASLNFLQTLLNASTSCGATWACGVEPKQQPLNLGQPPMAFSASFKRSTSSILRGEFLTQLGSIILSKRLYHFWPLHVRTGSQQKAASRSG